MYIWYDFKQSYVCAYPHVCTSMIKHIVGALPRYATFPVGDLSHGYMYLGVVTCS